MVARRNRAFPDSNRIRNLQWYLLLVLLAGGTGMLVLGALGYLTGLPSPVPLAPP